MESGNLFEGLSPAGPVETFHTLAATPGVRIERIVSYGHTSPDGFWYDQDEDEWVTVLTGSARLRFESGQQVLAMTPGVWAWIPAHERHRVEWTDPSQPTVWIAVHVKREKPRQSFPGASWSCYP